MDLKICYDRLGRLALRLTTQVKLNIHRSYLQGLSQGVRLGNNDCMPMIKILASIMEAHVLADIDKTESVPGSGAVQVRGRQQGYDEAVHVVPQPLLGVSPALLLINRLLFCKLQSLPVCVSHRGYNVIV